jgi:hypothetical protein
MGKRKKPKTDEEIIEELRLYHHNEAADRLERALAYIKKLHERGNECEFD